MILFCAVHTTGEQHYPAPRRRRERNPLVLIPPHLIFFSLWKPNGSRKCTDYLFGGSSHFVSNSPQLVHVRTYIQQTYLLLRWGVNGRSTFVLLVPPTKADGTPLRGGNAVNAKKKDHRLSLGLSSSSSWSKERKPCVDLCGVPPVIAWLA